MDKLLFKEKFEDAVLSAKKNKARGTQVAARLFLNNGSVIIVKQKDGTWFKYDCDTEQGLLQIGDRITLPLGLQEAEPTAQNEQPTQDGGEVQEETPVTTTAQQKNVNYIDIENIIGFSVEYITE